MPVQRRLAVPTNLILLRRTIVEAFMRGDFDTFQAATLEAKALLPRRPPHSNPRRSPVDSQGWKVPSPYTRARLVYDGLQRGLTPRDICSDYGLTYLQVSSSIHFIKGKL